MLNDLSEEGDATSSVAAAVPVRAVWKTADLSVARVTTDLLAADWERGMLAVIEAGTCGPPVPDRWLSLAGKLQDRGGDACALGCIAAAAVHFGLVYEAMPPRALLLGVTPPSARRAISRRCNNPGVLPPADLEALAVAAGMRLRLPAQQRISQFLRISADRLWVALVRQRFVDPAAGTKKVARKAVVRSHYVLVLDYLKRSKALVVFSPHPWNRPVSCVGLEMFEHGWLAAHRLQPPWAGLLDVPFSPFAIRPT